MIKKVRKSRSPKLANPVENKTSDQDCYGELYDSDCQQCRMCHDDVLCMIVWQKKHKPKDKTIKLDNVPIERILKIANGESFDTLLDAVKHYAGGVVEDGIIEDWFRTQLRVNKFKIDADRIVRNG